MKARPRPNPTDWNGLARRRRDDGKLQIKATSFSLVVTATDAAGNTTTKTVVPVFGKNGKENEAKTGNDKNDDKNSEKGDDKKGG